MFAHHLFPVNRKNKNLIFEMTSLSRFEAPSRYVHDIQAINGNDIPNTAKQHEVLTFLNLNVYAPTVYNEKIIMPVAKEAFRYYYFSLEETFEEEGLRSEEHTSELQSRDSISYAVFCLKKKNFHYYLRRTSFSFLSSSFSSLLFSFFFFFFFFMIRRPPISTLILTLFPYTTLFRSIPIFL